MARLTTSDLARTAGVHPNTIRNYEKNGYISPVPRASNNYRIFNQTHLNQVLLVQMAFKVTWLGGDIRKTALQIVEHTASLELDRAIQVARKLLNSIREDKGEAEEAMVELEEWAQGQEKDDGNHNLSTSQAAERLNISIYMLRDWGRNGLINVPRNPDNGYRIYGAKEMRRLRIIRILRRANYSYMAILKMLEAFDNGRENNFEQVITLDQDEDIFFATDNWLTTLKDLEKNGEEMIEHLKMMS